MILIGLYYNIEHYSIIKSQNFEAILKFPTLPTIFSLPCTATGIHFYEKEDSRSLYFETPV